MKLNLADFESHTGTKLDFFSPEKPFLQRGKSKRFLNILQEQMVLNEGSGEPWSPYNTDGELPHKQLTEAKVFGQQEDVLHKFAEFLLETTSDWATQSTSRGHAHNEHIMAMSTASTAIECREIICRCTGWWCGRYHTLLAIAQPDGGESHDPSIRHKPICNDVTLFYTFSGKVHKALRNFSHHFNLF